MIYPTVQLSDSNIHRAKLCLTNSPNSPHNVCITRSSIASLSSFIGPNHTNHRFKIVKFVLSVICPSWLVVARKRCKRCSIVKNKATTGLGGYCHSVTDGSIKPVRALKRGRRWRGHGIRRNSCGAEYMKLNICGMNKSRSVLEKCPRIPTTANTIPAK